MRILPVLLLSILLAFKAGAQCPTTVFVMQNGLLAVAIGSATVTPVPGASNKYTVHWGDGSISSGWSPQQQHTYLAAGTYNVQLMYQHYDSVTNVIYCQDTASQTISVVSCSSAINAVHNGNGSYTFSAATAVPGFSYTWNFGDGTGDTGTVVTHSYNSPGNYQVTLSTVSSSPACSSSSNYSVTPGPGSINGVISWDSTISNMVATNVKVWLIVMDQVQNTLTAVDSTTVSGISTASYSFTNAAAGLFLVKAAIIPGSSGFSGLMPTYHPSSLYWNNAATVVNTGGFVMNINIALQSGTNPGGPGFIGGNISQGANKGTSSGVENILVMLRGAGNNVASFTYTDANGDYSFSNVAAGSYTVYPEAMTYITTPSATLSIGGGSNSITGVHFRQTPTELKPVPSGISDPLEHKRFRVYPNPAGAAVTMTWQSFTGAGSIRLTDVTGRVLFEQSVAGTKAGDTELPRLQPGVYCVELITPEGRQAETLLIQR